MLTIYIYRCIHLSHLAAIAYCKTSVNDEKYNNREPRKRKGKEMLKLLPCRSDYIYSAYIEMEKISNNGKMRMPARRRRGNRVAMAIRAI